MVQFGSFVAGVGLSLLIAFRFLPSTIDESGKLVEPFFLLPLGTLGLFAGAVFVVIGFARRPSKR